MGIEWMGSLGDVLASRFLRPQAWPLAIVVLLAAGWAARQVGRRRRLATECFPVGLPSTGHRSAVLKFCTAAGILMAAGTVTGPVFTHGTQLRPATDLVVWVAWDVSASMSVGSGPFDNRLDAGRRVIHEALATVPGARVGVAVFGPSGHALVPPTRDPQAIEPFLASVRPGLFSDPGTTHRGVQDVLDLAGESPDPAHLVLITDGEWSADSDESGSGPRPLSVPDNVSVHLVWTDTPGAGAVVGEVGLSTPVEEPGRELATQSGGLFLPTSERDAGSRLGGELHALAREGGTESTDRRPVDGTGALAGLAALLLFVGAGRTQGRTQGRTHGRTQGRTRGRP